VPALIETSALKNAIVGGPSDVNARADDGVVGDIPNTGPMGAGKGTKTSGTQSQSQAKDKAKAGGKNLVRNSGSQDKDRNPESQADREKAINDVLTKIDNTLQDFNKKKSGGKVDAAKAIEKDTKKTSLSPKKSGQVPDATEKSLGIKNKSLKVPGANVKANETNAKNAGKTADEKST
jgi:hypothetical protein